ncbi:protein REGULATOR OF FATTY ACID COMPOSITION 3, chloroplastic [Silene latifolia]|uniref:protein REGULATOR OF FATTY ACID COMPOSITION 3, chloroplastic n=1 Tax=Silene latifolia TaxID=37657 RepID=UPI003D76CF11
MDTLITSASNPSISFLSPSLSKQSSGFSLSSNSCFIIRNGHSSFVPISSHNLVGSSRRRSLMVEAKKGNQSKNNKVDSHSFAPKSDEAIGPFPEAVLLKQKKVQEDGRALPEFADEDEEELFEFLNLQLESDLDADQMRHYEVVYLIHQDHKDKVEDVNNKIRDFIREKKGRVWRFSDWGMRRLAYKIQKTTHAHYILMNFELGTQWINEFKQILDQDERVIRHLVIKRKNAITENCPPPPEFHTLRADMVDEYDVDDMEEDEDEDDEEEYDDDEGDLEGDEDDEIDGENVSSSQETDSRKPIAKRNSNTKREKVLR